MNTAGSHYFSLMKAKTAVRDLIRALMKLGYSEAKAIEVAECILEEAGRDGLNTSYFWSAIDHVAPIPKAE